MKSHGAAHQARCTHVRWVSMLRKPPKRNLDYPIGGRLFSTGADGLRF
jgi:hypothetical protein